MDTVHQINRWRRWFVPELASEAEVNVEANVTLIADAHAYAGAVPL